MIVLYIILGLLFLLFLLLNIPVYLELKFKEKLLLNIKYLNFSFSVISEEKEEHDKNKKRSDNKDEDLKDNKDEKKKDNYISRMFKQRGLLGIINILKELIVISTDATKKTFNKVLIDKIDLDIMVVGEDAYDTALKTGKIQSFMSLYILRLIKNLNDKKHNIKIYPGFLAEKTKIDLYVLIHFRPISILNIAVSALFRFIKSVYKDQIKLQRERA